MGNIHKSAYEQFRKQDDSLTFNVSYDGLSLMHYNAFEGFGIDRNKPTMISLVSCYLNSLARWVTSLPSIFRWNQSMIIFMKYCFGTLTIWEGFQKILMEQFRQKIDGSNNRTID